MAKLTLTDIGAGTAFQTAIVPINANNAAIETALENTLSRDGTVPNTMGAYLDMNSNQILNLPNPATANSPLRLQDLSDFIGGGTVSSLPAGGTAGQPLTKINATDFNTEWSDVVDGLTAGTNITITGTTPATIATSNTPTFTGVTTTSATVSGLTASSAVATDASKNLVSVTNTGSGNNVLATSPTLVTPLLGTPTSGTLTNCTGLPVSTGVSGLGTNVATFLATPSSANLAAALTDETGSGANVFATSPTLVTPLLGTPTSGTLTNCTGLPIATGVSGLGTGIATFLATPSSANLASAITNETGSGALVFGTSPTVTTPNIVGTSTNDNASAGSVGEYVESILASGSATPLTTGTAKTVTSISLTAGDWDVQCVGNFIPAATTSITQLGVYLSLVTNATDTTAGRFVQLPMAAVVSGGQGFALGVPSYRFSLASTTTIYLVVSGIFTVSTLTAWGIISGRRLR